MNHEGIESTKVIDNIAGVEVRKVKGIANVIPYYGAKGCYANGGAKQTIYGFYYKSDDIYVGFWFKRKSDALYAADWIVRNNWDGRGDLESALQSALFADFIDGGRKGELRELGRVYF